MTVLFSKRNMFKYAKNVQSIKMSHLWQAGREPKSIIQEIVLLTIFQI